MARNPDRKEDRVIFKVIRGEVNAFMPDSEANPGMILCYAHLAVVGPEGPQAQVGTPYSLPGGVTCWIERDSGR